MNIYKNAELRRKYSALVKDFSSSEYKDSDAQSIEEAVLNMEDLIYIRELVASVPERHKRLIIVMAVLHWMKEYRPAEYAILMGGN